MIKLLAGVRPILKQSVSHSHSGQRPHFVGIGILSYIIYYMHKLLVQNLILCIEIGTSRVLLLQEIFCFRIGN